MKQKICILGSTGSIGKSTLEIISKNRNDFEVILLSGNSNFRLLISQAKKFKPKYIYSNNFYLIKKIKYFCNKNKIIIISDLNSLKKVKFDITIAAISGISGLLPTLNIIKFSKKILIANKESIICGWKFINKELKKNNCSFVPIDSEHFSIFKLIENKSINSIKNIFLTASGGPFFGKNINLKKVTPLQAIKHPNWKMGKKISVDSATLMNKILEVIEASLIFNLPINKFKIIIHPESLVHAIVQFKSGLSSMLYYENDMKIPIINSLYKNFNDLPKKQDFDKKYFLKLSFYKPNFKKVPSLAILQSKEILNETGFTLINVLNEILVERFLKKKILFSDIVKELLNILYSKTVLNYLKNKKINKIDDVFSVCNFSRSLTKC